MHLAYLDDSDTKCKRRKWQVMSGVIIEDKAFKLIETGMSVAQDSLQLSPEQLEKFEEFHACELYGGYGVFEGIDQALRFEAVERLLFSLGSMDLCVVYGVVDLERLGKEVYATADPLDICFRICARGIESWSDQKNQATIQAKLGENIENYKIENMTPIMVDGILQELVLVIVDECDKKIRDTLHKSFRSMRPQRWQSKNQSPYSIFHDDMYFGDSRYSAGIQLADLCSYFIARHLEGDEEIEFLYQMIEPHIVGFDVYPPESAKEVKKPSEDSLTKDVLDGK